LDVLYFTPPIGFVNTIAQIFLTICRPLSPRFLIVLSISASETHGSAQPYRPSDHAFRPDFFQSSDRSPAIYFLLNKKGQKIATLFLP